MDARKDRPFYCDICDCELKDSANYLDHINGKKHNRNKGINLKQFKDSTLEEVKEMLNKKRKERDERLNNKEQDPKAGMTVPGERNYYEDYDDDDDENDDQEDEEEEEGYES